MRTRLQQKVAGDFKAPCCKLRPPTDFPDEAMSLWDEIVSSVGPRHFNRGDVTMIAQYVVLTAVTRKQWASVIADPNPEAIKDYTTVARTLTALGTKLRLVPSSRDIRQKVGQNDPAAQGVIQGMFGED